MWKGYLDEKTLNKDIYDFIPKDDQGNLEYTYLHTSGHATIDAICRLCEIVSASKIFPIHSDKPDKLEELKDAGKIQGEIHRFKDIKDETEI